jgi:hypothetical protein
MCETKQVRDKSVSVIEYSRIIFVNALLAFTIEHSRIILLTVWAWRVVQGSRHSKWLLIHFPAMREGQVYYLDSGYGETDENNGVGPAEKKNAVGLNKTRNPHKKLHLAVLPH